MDLGTGFSKFETRHKASRSPGPADHEKNGVATAVPATSARGSIRKSKRHASDPDRWWQILALYVIASVLIVLGLM
jgi:hypothetical protein